MLERARRHRDHIAGALLFLLGLGTVFQARDYRIGSLVAMGPGFFPVALGLLLAGLGILIALNAANETVASVGPLAPDWRGWLCIAGGILAFVLLAPPLGMFPSTFACVFISAFGDRTATPLKSLILALGVSAFGVLLFSTGLHIPLPAFRWSF